MSSSRKRRRQEPEPVAPEALPGQYNKRHKGPPVYDVFLNFRGPDSRDTVADILYWSLTNVGVRVFRDNEEIRKGQKIEGELLSAITNSRIYIPIISKDYASSRWCLRELTKMIECWETSKGNNEKVILPIFFDVQVSDVKLRSKLYTKALRKHKKELGNGVVNKWTEALKEVARIKGWNLRDCGLDNLTNLIKDEVLSELSMSESIPVVPDHIVGINDRVKDVMRLLELESPEVRFIALHGIGGIGKTTLATFIYDNISSQFQGSCILLDVRGSTSAKDRTELQKKLLKDTLKLKFIKLSHCGDGIKKISKKLCNQKVLIVLDDVDKEDYLSILAAEPHWFGPWSRVIITTDNTEFLVGKGYNLYELKPMNPGDALQSFCQYAFKEPKPPDKFRYISSEIVDTIGGLPLAIRTVGSLLCGQKSYELWKFRLDKLKAVPLSNVQTRLLMSYESLEEEPKEIFLDIACFFNNKKKEDPFYFWQACRLYPKPGLEILVYKCLIRIDQDGRLCMHNQLRNLGRAIAQGNIETSERQPTRLWPTEDAMDVIGAQVDESIVAAKLGTLDDDDNYLRPEKFAKSIDLRLLQFRGGNFNGNFRDVLHKLAWLSWFQSPQRIEAVNLNLKQLTILKLSGSHIDEGWEGWGLFKGSMGLKVLHLTECTRLKRTPDFSVFKALERLILKDCEALEEISSSITELKQLKYLKVSNGSRKHENAYSFVAPARPQLLPNSIGELKSLQVLKISNVGLTELDPSIGQLKALKHLCLRCPHLQYLPNTVTTLTSLKELDISDSPIKKLPRGIGALKRLVIKRNPVSQITRNTEVPE